MTKQQEKELKQDFRILAYVYLASSKIGDNWEGLTKYMTKKDDLRKNLSIEDYKNIIFKLEGKDYYFFTWENEILNCHSFKEKEKQEYLRKLDIASKNNILV